MADRSTAEISTLPLKGFTLRWYEKLAANREIRAALVNSLTVAACTVVLATSLGVLAAVASRSTEAP